MGHISNSKTSRLSKEYSYHSPLSQVEWVLDEETGLYEYFALASLITSKPNPHDLYGMWRPMIEQMKEDVTKRILFLGGGKRVSLLERFKRAAEKESIHLEFYCYELLEYVHLKDLATVILGKPFNEFSVADLDAVCLKYDIDLIVPLMDAAVGVCALYKERGPKAQVFAPEYRVADACHDKLAFQEWIKENHLSELYPWPTKFPMFAKSRFGYGSRKQGVIKRKSDIKKLPEGEEYVFQQLLKPPEYTVDCYVNRYGVVVSAVPRERLLVSRGEVENSATVGGDVALNLIAKCRHILAGRGFSGPVTVQFMEGKVIEVNARFGGGVILSIEAGADHCQMMLRDLLDRPLYRPTYEPNVLMLRSYRETFYRSYDA